MRRSPRCSDPLRMNIKVTRVAGRAQHSRRRLTGVFTKVGALTLVVEVATEAGMCVGSPAPSLLKHCGSWMVIEALNKVNGWV
jgi:hypothetical protein